MKKIRIFSLVCLGLLIMGGNILLSAPPLNPDFLRKKPAHFKPCRTMSREMLQSLQKKGIIRKPGVQGVLQPVTKKILVIPVQFNDTQYPQLPSTYATDAAALFSQVQSFYYENSYSLVTFTAVIASSVTLPNDVTYYNEGTDDDLTRLFTDATAQLPSPPGAGYSDYDYVAIYHAGPGGEESNNTSDLWSLYFPTALSSGGTGAKTFDGFVCIPAAVTQAGYTQLGVICHEFGHQMGLPDLYDTSTTGGVSTMGAWSLMDWPYGKDGSGNPPHFDIWSKNFLQFVDLNARQFTSDTAGLFGDIETSQTTGYYKIPISVASPSEYFVAEYRDPDSSHMMYDLTAPATGIIIWHIDDSIALDPTRLENNDINTGSPHRGVALVSATGVFIKPGHANDAFVTGSSFLAPQSNTFNGKVSGLALSDIVLSNGNASTSMKDISVESTQGINKITTFPNPAGKGYPHPRSAEGIITTFVFQATRPPENITLDIYTIAAERVASIGKDRFVLRFDKSSNNSWIYEFDWNGKNDANSSVAQGIYFYRIKADAVTQTGKLAVVR